MQKHMMYMQDEYPVISSSDTKIQITVLFMYIPTTLTIIPNN